MKAFSVLALTLVACAPLLAQPVEKPAKKPAAKKTVTPAGIAHLRILHALPGAGAVDVYARGDEKIKTGLNFKNLTEYTEIKSGKLPLKITASGKTEALLEDSALLTKEKWYTLAIYGDTKPMLLLINESTGKDDPEKARARVVHLVSGAGAVTVTKPSKRAADGNANFLPKPLEYGESASKTLKPATETLQLRDSAGKILKEVADLKFDAGARYTVFAVGKAGATDDTALDLIVKTAAQ